MTRLRVCAGCLGWMTSLRELIRKLSLRIELLSEIKQTTTPAFTSVVPTGTESIARVEPTALDNFAGTEEKEDVIAKKIQDEEVQLLQRAEKRKAIEALHDLYEVEIQKLGETEAALLADRLTQLRKAALRDIPNRFDVSVRNYRDECDKWVGRLDKCECGPYFTRICWAGPS